MAELVCLHEKKEVETFCRGNTLLHVYSIGDLDDFFWPYTTWYAWRQQTEIQHLVLLYTGCTVPTVLALADEPVDGMRDLLRALVPLLPRKFYAHLSPGTTEVLADDYHIESHGRHYKMGLYDRARLARIEAADVERLAPADASELRAMYDVSYPRNWFVPRMLETGSYYGIRRDGMLVSVAGIHVYSPTYQVAALGNIATHPEYRGRGFATAATARLCQELLLAGIEHIGLNVKAENASAIACYEQIGFEHVAEYEECTLQLKR